MDDLSISSTQIETYRDVSEFDLDVRRDKQRQVSILEGKGHHCPKIVGKFTRRFWYISQQTSIGVIGDLDTGPVYRRLKTYISTYLRTPCKKHNVNPVLNFYDTRKTLTLSFNRDRVTTIWTFDIPESLEIQISRALKGNHSALRTIDNEDETIRAASRMLHCSEEDVIRRSVSLVRGETWFTDLTRKLQSHVGGTGQAN